ncbi:nucleoside triphosphate pyrophosphohydrolase [Anaerobacillus alkalidiazotrophicus]|uniref:Nucleoside triphosphate pyrophosphohydrolase n=1 Tax=Anaerobacillus alkalidiazotrophicus TaxID=472963 RepID=A0A1S2M7H5_9BACI|nr:nucleoside triphosphate pyrophosphohydrolase [Anaerobacillus alkalidiazotrophicus]OIJ20516.1 nucleoside triphosphate pyrophosphohydrolase [Anaerobacillus alkalidiazotrophicus]
MGKIIILGLGAGDLNQMPLGIYHTLMKSENVYLRTKEHPVVEQLEAEGFTYQSFDHIYENNDQFKDVYQEITSELIEKAKEKDIVYGVPGHPFVAESTVQLLVQQSKEHNITLEIVGGQSFLDNMFQALQIDPIEGCQIVDGTELLKAEIQVRHHIIICQVYDAFIASEVKLTLMDLLPDEYEVTIVTAAGSSQEEIKKVPLYELDRVATLNNLTAVYVPPVKDETILYRDFDKLREVIAHLRGPNGCPWDKKQTHTSLKKYLLEEAYEVLDAIDEEDEDHLAEELGDVLLQVMLHAQIGEDEGMFTVDDVISSLTEKMVRRHPHVFGEGNLPDSDEVIKKWDEIKRQEKETSGQSDHSFLSGVPKSMPALSRASNLQKKAAKVGFDWDEVAPIWMKVQEEIAEFMIETKQNNSERARKEFGDVLFAFVNLARYYQIDPELALHSTNEKFFNRFAYIEKTLQERELTFAEVDLAYLDAIWEDAKKM